VKTIALLGNPIDGFTAFGPYDDFDAAAQAHTGTDVWIMDLRERVYVDETPVEPLPSVEAERNEARPRVIDRMALSITAHSAILWEQYGDLWKTEVANETTTIGFGEWLSRKRKAVR